MTKRLSEECRRFIVYKLKNNESITVIANELEKSKSTISRGIKKNRYLVIDKKDL